MYTQNTYKTQTESIPPLFYGLLCGTYNAKITTGSVSVSISEDFSRKEVIS